MTNSIIYNVEQLRFNNGKRRLVEVPQSEVVIDETNLLELVYTYGQNDIQPQQGFPSVSTGDVIHHIGLKYLILDIGFELLSDEKYEFIKNAQIKSEGNHKVYQNLLYDQYGVDSFQFC